MDLRSADVATALGDRHAALGCGTNQNRQDVGQLAIFVLGPLCVRSRGSPGGRKTAAAQQLFLKAKQHRCILSSAAAPQ